MIRDSHGELVIDDETDIIVVRKTVRDAATRLNFGLTDVTRIVTAASELARNIYLYAGSGKIKWHTITEKNTIGIELVFEDHGPGIPDPELVMQEGYSTSNGLGLGLPGSRRLMDELEIQSETGKGTTVITRKWQRRY